MRTQYIFVAGGVMSGVGKGIASASIGKILQSRGFSVTAIKIDPYVNVDAGTMNPTEHGEVFVLDDGMECDQDMGNYERFLDVNLSSDNYMTTGSVYQAVINRERALEYKGKCVEVVPHIPMEVINKIKKAAKKNKAEIVITEIGGTVGEYQNILFLEAVRMLKAENPGDVLLVLVSYLPIIGDGHELKTKPTQYAVRTLNSAGLQPDIIIARSKNGIDKKRKEKIAVSCGVEETGIISAPNVESIYDIPVNFEKDNLSDFIIKKLKIKPKRVDLKEWRAFVNKIKKSVKPIKIGIVGKYFTTGEFVLADSYISIIEAVKHAAYATGIKPEIEWLNSEEFEQNKEKIKELSNYNGVIVPGGFGGRGVEGKIATIKYLRENKIPYFGICYGMQLAVIEYARNIAGLSGATTTEIDKQTEYPVIDIQREQKSKIEKNDYGGTMRLGAYNAEIKKGSIAYMAYKQTSVSERHRHRYEVNEDYIETMRKSGLIFSGQSPDGKLMEIIELPRDKHPFFVGVQFHPEFKSRPLSPHPLFKKFIEAAKNDLK
ncbi:MAG: CTP synthase [Candidatus Terrybacteria bacterium CG10_big_fil_rev_8_21_14_0_10_41_10]|uniref:CTP synthase n=1 Tax=Candidatus Terrybacteria bacterium CG10_big_fil_rev_8_21_14_0_10_41_10 TaxID=1975026 RepID=A0A2M8LAJ4_9BACT|nr:MAG: CTP synthase [Candidatus Terrybacteria bacterium CG10_big_fil_rev_8_21_14_0_10_41_10]